MTQHEPFMHPCKIFIDCQCDCIGECGDENAKSWQKLAEDTAYECVSDYIAGVEDFKAALRADIEKEIRECESMLTNGMQPFVSGRLYALKRDLELLDTVEPLTK